MNRFLQAWQDRRELVLETVGAGSELVPGAPAHEQFVAEDGAQARQGAAHRGLAEVGSRCGAGDVPLFEQRGQWSQEVEVHLVPMRHGNTLHASRSS